LTLLAAAFVEILKDFSGFGQIEPKSARKSVKFLREIRKTVQKSRFKPQRRVAENRFLGIFLHYA
jgi:hypothetical protein